MRVLDLRGQIIIKVEVTCKCGMDRETNTASEGRQLTLGEQRVRLSFNPTENPKVDEIKARAAELIDLLEGMRDPEPRSEKNRCISVAQTEIETAAMYGVKAATA